MPARRDWQSLPGECYRSDAVYEREFDAIWSGAWLFACPACELAAPGDFVTLWVGRAPVLLVRADDGIRDFHNVCPHRGTLLCDAPAGRLGRLIVCPYHQWSFTRSGGCTRAATCPRSIRARPARPAHDHRGRPGVFQPGGYAGDPAPLLARFAAAEPHGFSRAEGREGHRLSRRRQLEAGVGEQPRMLSLRRWPSAVHPREFRRRRGRARTPANRGELAAVLARAAAYWETEGLSVKHAAGGLGAIPIRRTRTRFPCPPRTVLADGFETESMDGRRVAPYMGDLRSPDVGALCLTGGAELLAPCQRRSCRPHAGAAGEPHSYAHPRYLAGRCRRPGRHRLFTGFASAVLATYQRTGLATVRAGVARRAVARLPPRAAIPRP